MNLKLSQCMIVKDEEKNIARALSWGRDIMWEQIVVDTGSTDRTAAIAERMGANVYHFPWTDDFAAAKNYALERAKGDWIIFLDADEYFLPEDAKRLPRFLQKLHGEDCHAVAAGWIQTDEDTDILRDRKTGKLEWLRTVQKDGSDGFSLAGTQVRIFRNRAGIRYEGRIHEKLCAEHGQLICMDASQELSILHTGYSAAQMKEKKKVERNIALLLKETALRPNDHRPMIYLGDSFFQQKDYKEALRWYEKAARCLPDERETDNIQISMLFKHLILIDLEFGEEQAALEAYEEGTARFPEEADYDYLMGRDYVHRGLFREGERYLQKALAQLERYGEKNGSPLMARNLLEAWELLIQCFYENGDLTRCVDSAVTILRAAPYTIGALVWLLKAFCREAEAANAPRVKAFLGRLYDLGKGEDRLFLLEAAEEAGYDGLRAIL